MKSRIFFRTDDVGWGDENFFRLTEIFQSHGAPLVAAVIPALVNLETVYKIQSSPADIEVSAHGFKHTNHNLDGKKTEFPDDRDPKEVLSELALGYQLCLSAFGDRFNRVFVPPWNRMAEGRWQIELSQIGYRAISAFGGPNEPGDRKSFNAQIDLHSTKHPRYGSPDLLCNELKQIANSQLKGIMLHHAIMTDTDFDFVDRLIDQLRGEDCRIVGFRDLL